MRLRRIKFAWRDCLACRPVRKGVAYPRYAVTKEIAVPLTQAETLRKIGQAESFGLTFEQVQAMAKGMVETVQALAFQQDREHCDAISD